MHCILALIFYQTEVFVAFGDSRAIVAYPVVGFKVMLLLRVIKLNDICLASVVPETSPFNSTAPTMCRRADMGTVQLCQ